MNINEDNTETTILTEGGLGEACQNEVERTLQAWHCKKEIYSELLKLVQTIKRQGVWQTLTALELMSDAVLSTVSCKYTGTIYGLTRNDWVALHCELECGNMFSQCEDILEEEAGSVQA
jgi:hypothetical protein